MHQKRASGHPKRRAFLAAFKETGHIGAACRAAGIGRMTFYDWKKKDPAFLAEFNEAMEEAADMLELEARRRAINGTEVMKFYQGKPCMVPLMEDGRPVYHEGTTDMVMVPYIEHRYSDMLLLALLNAKRPNEFRRNAKAEVTVSGGGAAPVAMMSNDEIIEKAIKYNVVDRLPPALREMAEKRLSAGTPPAGMGVARETQDVPPGHSERGS